jgi:hypothetical protein
VASTKQVSSAAEATTRGPRVNLLFFFTLGAYTEIDNAVWTFWYEHQVFHQPATNRFLHSLLLNDWAFYFRDAITNSPETIDTGDCI